jgi:predicted nucleic acid-binding protein
MIVVADTSPIRYLILTNFVEVLPQLFQKILIPTAVAEELKHPRAPLEVKNWAAALPNWIEVRRVAIEVDNLLLDRGEAEAIHLAMETKADFIVLDEIKGREIARRSGLQITGMLGVLEKASEREMLDLGTAIERLLKTNFRADRQLITDLLARETQRGA